MLYFYSGFLMNIQSRNIEELLFWSLCDERMSFAYSSFIVWTLRKYWLSDVTCCKPAVWLHLNPFIFVLFFIYIYLSRSVVHYIDFTAFCWSGCASVCTEYHGHLGLLDSNSCQIFPAYKGSLQIQYELQPDLSGIKHFEWFIGGTVGRS